MVLRLREQDQPLLRLPNELSRHNLKTAQIQIKAAQDKVTDIIAAGTKATTQAANVDASEDAASKATSSIDQAIARLQTLKRKLSTLNESTEKLYKQSAARVQHLEDLYKIPSLADVKYEEWSRVRLDRLLVDYLLRMGYTQSAKALAKEKGVEDLVDCEAFEQCGKIERSLRVERRVEAALGWCTENKGGLKKMAPVVTNGGTTNGASAGGATANTFEYELRLQQCVELARQGHRNDDMAKLAEARQFASKYLHGHPDQAFKSKATLLLCFPPPNGLEDDEDMDMDHPLSVCLDFSNPSLSSWKRLTLLRAKELYSPGRWTYLSHLFLETHHAMYQLPQAPLLHMALTAGLSALKTPACHSKYLSPTSGLNASTSPSHASPPPQDNFDSMDGVLTNDDTPAAAMSLTSSVCPICSTELNKLSKHLPFAHHSKSHVEHDPVVLPNGRIYGRERLERLNEKLGVGAGSVRDPMDVRGESWGWDEVGKVYFL
jgi:macrophage erythroblast attacher